MTNTNVGWIWPWQMSVGDRNVFFGAGRTQPDADQPLSVEMRDPIGELVRVMLEVGVAGSSVDDPVQDLGWDVAVSRLQQKLLVPETKVVDPLTWKALDKWGSSFSVQLERALEATETAGALVSEVGVQDALAALQQRYNIPVTGVVDLDTARVLINNVYRPTNRELVEWGRLQQVATPLEYLGDPTGFVTDAATGVGDVADLGIEGFGAILRRVANRVGKDPVTYISLAATFGLRVVFPPLQWAPLVGALVYELTDELSKGGEVEGSKG